MSNIYKTILGKFFASPLHTGRGKGVGLLFLLMLFSLPMMAAGNDFDITSGLQNFLNEMGIIALFTTEQGLKQLVMIGIGCFLLYLAIKKEYEPLLLLPIAFGMILTNLPGAGMFDTNLWNNEFLNHDSEYYHSYGHVMQKGGLLDILYIGVKAGIYPCLIFLGVGAMTDFGPLIANPKSLLLGAAAQIGIFATFLVTQIDVFGFTAAQSASIGIIGGADGPTAIFLSSKLAPHLMGAIAVAAYSYMALIPVFQPPIMKMLTSEKERKIRMKAPDAVSQRQKIIFPILGLLLTTWIIPSGLPLLGMLFFGNLLKESGVTRRLADTAKGPLIDIVTILLGFTVGCSTQASTFLTTQSIGIFALGAISFLIATASGVLFVKFFNLFLPEGKKINPLIGNAGVSAVPDAARISQEVGLKYDPTNYLLMHAMGPNVAGVIGSAVAAGVLLAFLG